MFLLRNASHSDLEDLYQLSLKVFFLNLPRNKDLLSQMIEDSLRSFRLSSKEIVQKNAFHEDTYFFVLEDLKHHKIIGCCMIHGQHGTKESPHLSLRITPQEQYSHSLQLKRTYDLLTLEIDENGPTEIGGLVLSPEYRGHGGKLGKRLAFVRFLYMRVFPEKFKDIIHTELMPPLPAQGCPILWKELGKKFFEQDYKDVDELSRYNKEFLISLFPKNGIYKQMLSLEAQSALGLVAPETVPVKSMFEKINFRYIQEVDPLDGGPHYRCWREDILPIAESFSKNVKFISSMTHLSLEKKKQILLTLPHPDYLFSAYSTSDYDLREEGELLLPSSVLTHFPKLPQEFSCQAFFL